MALINTLRNKMGKIVVVFLALSMGAFILTDLFQSNSLLFGGSQTEIGEMASSSVTYEEFQKEVERLSYGYALNTGRNPSGQEMDLIRNQAWQQLIVTKVFKPQYAELGIAVTDEEMVEMVQGTNIHPGVRQAFTNPQTGIFDKDQLVAYLQQLSTLPEQNRQAWIAFEQSLRPQRENSKYENLFNLTNYASKYEAKDEYMKTGSTASIDYLYVPYFAVADSLVEVREAELEEYLSENSDNYQREETKNIDYISFQIAPSSEDSAIVLAEIQDLRNGLQTASDDSLFASINSDGLTPFQQFTPATLPTAFAGINKVGFTSEVELEGNKYVVYKISDISSGDEQFVKASHILFKWTDDSDAAKREARSRANGILRDIKRGTNFEEMARVHGTDGTANSGGDLGWFGENSSFVQEFKDATFGFRGTGLLPSLVETQFGYHIIKVTEPKTSEVYKVATVEKELFVSDETLNETYRQAEIFALEAENLTDFTKKAGELALDVKKARTIRQNDARIGGLNNARNIVFWLFNKASQGEVSEVFELEDQYIVAVQTDAQEKGTVKLESVRNEIARKVRDQKKADMIIESLSGASGSTLEEKANAYGSDARVNSADVTLNATSIASVGYAPEAVGVAFSLEPGEQTQPFKIDNGIIIVLLNEKTMATELEDYSDYIATVTNGRRSFRRREEPFIDQNVYNAALEFAEVEDNRYKFF